MSVEVMRMFRFTGPEPEDNNDVIVLYELGRYGRKGKRQLLTTVTPDEAADLARDLLKAINDE